MGGEGAVAWSIAWHVDVDVTCGRGQNRGRGCGERTFGGPLAMRSYMRGLVPSRVDLTITLIFSRSSSSSELVAAALLRCGGRGPLSCACRHAIRNCIMYLSKAAAGSRQESEVEDPGRYRG